MTKPQAAGIVAALLVGSFVGGRLTAPTPPAKVIEHTVTVEVAAKSAEAHSSQAALSNVAVDKGVRWRERIVYRPGGVTTVIRTVERKDEREALKETTAIADAKTVEVHTVEVEKLKLVETAKPRWAIGAAAGLGLDRRWRYQGDAAMRVAGGLWLTGVVDVSSRALLVGGRLQF